MKPLLSLTLFLLLLTACAPVISQTAPLPAVDLPANAPGVEITATTQVKVVAMATRTPPATPAPTLAASTAGPDMPTPVTEATGASQATPVGAVTNTPIAHHQTLEELGIAYTTYEDKVGGLAFDYPSSWQVNALPDDIKLQSLTYTASLRSVVANRGPKWQEGIPPDMAAIDVTVVMDGPTTLEQAIAERRAAAADNEMGLPIQVALEQEWVLRDGTKAYCFLYNLGKDPIGGYGDRDKMSYQLVTIINDNMVLVNGMGDLSLFNVVAASLRQLSPGQ